MRERKREMVKNGEKNEREREHETDRSNCAAIVTGLL